MSVCLLPNPTESPSFCQIKTAQSPRIIKKARRPVWPFATQTNHYKLIGHRDSCGFNTLVGEAYFQSNNIKRELYT